MHWSWLMWMDVVHVWGQWRLSTITIVISIGPQARPGCWRRGCILWVHLVGLHAAHTGPMLLWQQHETSSIMNIP